MENVRVTDLYLAAFLMASGHALIRVDGPEGRRGFVFPPAAAESRQAYFGDATIKARLFAESVRSLKSLIHNSTAMAR